MKTVTQQVQQLLITDYEKLFKAFPIAFIHVDRNCEMLDINFLSLVLDRVL